MEQEQGQIQEKKQEESRLSSLVDKLILIAIFVFIAAVAGYIVNVAFGSFPLVRMNTTALTSFLLVLVAIPLVIRYAHLVFLALEEEEYGWATGSAIVCLALVVAAVNTIIFANKLDLSQQSLLFFDLITLGFQLRRIFLDK